MKQSHLKQSYLKSFYVLAFGVLILFFLTPTQGESAEKKVLRAGVAAVDISPVKFPVQTNGGFLPVFANKVKDPLFARALVLENGEEKFALVVVDNCLMPTSLADKVKEIVQKEIGFRADRISISTTHCHSAPALMGVHCATEDENYVKYFPGKVAEAIIQADKNLRPVKAGWGTIREPRFIFCRRFLMKPGTSWTIPSAFSGVKRDLAQMNPGRQNPNSITRTGVPDQTVYVLGFKTLDDKPYAVFANYSTHYAGSSDISADYFGVFARKTAELLQAPSDFVAIMSNGTSGDTNCIDFTKKAEDQKFDMYLVGEEIAKDVQQVWNNMKFQDWVPLKAIQSEMTLKIKTTTPEDVKAATEWLDKLKKEGKPIRTTEDVYAHETLIDAKLPPERTIKIQAYCIGEVGFTAIPCEIYSFTGHDLRANSPFTPTFVISLANGYNGYIPTTDSFELGGYTTWRTRSSILEPGAEPKIRAEALKLLETIAR